MAETEKEPKRLLMRMKGESEKIVFNLSIKKTNITASRSNISWQTEGEKREAMTDFILGGFKITADSDCRHEIKRCFLLERKAVTNLDSILKSRDITFLAKVHRVKVTVFPVVMYGCESWTLKKAECWWLVPLQHNLMFSNCGAGEDSWESLRVQGDQTS